MERNWLIAILLLGVLALNALVALASPRPVPENNLFFILLTALCLSQIGALGIWVVLSPQHWPLRWSMTAGVLYGWVWLLDDLSHPLSSESWLAAHLLATVMTVLPWRLRGYRWRSVWAINEPEAADVRRRWQLSIGTLLRWTALVALVCVRLKPSEIVFLNKDFAHQFFSDHAAMSILICPVLATVTVRAFSLPSISLVRAASLLAAGVVPGILMHDPPMPVFGTVMAAFYLGGFSVCQMMGYFIHRKPREKRPAEVALAGESLAPQSPQ